jgi:hypothetical protein
LGEHLLCTEGVRSSSLLISTIPFDEYAVAGCCLGCPRQQPETAVRRLTIEEGGSEVVDDDVGHGCWATGCDPWLPGGEPVTKGVGWMPRPLVPMKDVA